MILARWEWCIVKEKEGTKTMITYVPFTCQWKDMRLKYYGNSNFGPFLNEKKKIKLFLLFLFGKNN